MKFLFSISFMLITVAAFAQVKKDSQNTRPLFLSTIKLDSSSYLVNTNLKTISQNIVTAPLSRTSLDRINNTSNFVTLTKDFNKIYDFSNISTEVNLSKALDNVMYSGNFFNPKESHFSALNPKE